MTNGTYGLTQSVRQPASGGETLLGLGAAQRRAGMALLGDAADQETRRESQNKQVEAQAKAGNMQLGASAGATVGSAFGPWGTLIGGAIGAIAGNYF